MNKPPSTRHKTIGIIGAGVFGTGAAMELVRLGHELVVVDKDPRALETLLDNLPVSCKTVVGDAESVEVLREAGFSDVDVVIVAIGRNETAANHATINCKDIGRNVVAKAIDQRHGIILERLGADKVVYPEQDSGVRLGRMLTRTARIDMVELDEEVFIAEMQVRSDLVGRSLAELELPQRLGIQVVVIHRGNDILCPPVPIELIREGDVLVCVGSAVSLGQLSNGRL